MLDIIINKNIKNNSFIVNNVNKNKNNIGVRINRIKERLKKILDGKIN